MKTTIDLWHKVWPDPGAFVRASAQDLEMFAALVRADERAAPVQDNSNYRLDPPGLDALYTTPPAAPVQPVAYLHQCRKKPELKELSFKKHEPELFAKGYKAIPLSDATTPPAQPAPVQEPVGYVAENGVVDWNVCAPPILTDLYTTSPLALRTEQEPSQRKFENWLRSKWTAGYACQKLEGRYTDKAAQSFWECWQAAHGIKENT
jgi:hypothetical protein